MSVISPKIPSAPVLSIRLPPNTTTVDKLLDAPLSDDDISSFHHDFRVIWPDGPPDSTEYRVAINAFRALKHVTFDAPIPVLDVTNVYSWMKSRIKAIVFEKNLRTSLGGSDTIFIRRELLSQPAYGLWMNGAGFGLSSLCGLLVHEAGHYGKNHDCGKGEMDSSLEYGGAWACQYWWNRWCYEHGGVYFSEKQKELHRTNASYLLERFCNYLGRPDPAAREYLRELGPFK